MFARRQHGAAMVLVMVGMVALLAMVGLALDMGHLGLNKSRLQSTVDAAALAAAKVLDQTGSQPQASAAALSVFGLNAAQHPDLQRVVGAGLNISVQYLPDNYVRVVATDFTMWLGLTSLVGMDDLRTAASAVAGPSPTIDNACNIAPMVVCGDPAAGAPNWGYSQNLLQVLKLASGGGGNSGPIGPGNFQLIRLGGNGGSVVRQNMAGSFQGCVDADEDVETQTGNVVGPVTQGLNTRFGQYSGGGVNQTDYPPDVITSTPNPNLTYNDTTREIRQSGQVVITGDDITYDYQDYLEDLSTQTYNYQPAPNGPGVPLRRELVVPIADCSGSNNGNSTLPVLGFGCYFLLQPAVQQGTDNYVYGQFIENCQSGGVPGPDPGNAPGPYVIQLYDDPTSPDS